MTKWPTQGGRQFSTRPGHRVVGVGTPTRTTLDFPSRSKTKALKSIKRTQNENARAAPEKASGIPSLCLKDVRPGALA